MEFFWTYLERNEPAKPAFGEGQIVQKVYWALMKSPGALIIQNLLLYKIVTGQGEETAVPRAQE